MLAYDVAMTHQEEFQEEYCPVWEVDKLQAVPCVMGVGG